MDRDLHLTRTCDLLDCLVSVSLNGWLHLICDLYGLNRSRVYFIALDHLLALLLLLDCEISSTYVVWYLLGLCPIITVKTELFPLGRYSSRAGKGLGESLTCLWVTDSRVEYSLLDLMVYSSIAFCNCEVCGPGKGVIGGRKWCKEVPTVLGCLQWLTECQRVWSSTASGKRPLRADCILLYMVDWLEALVYMWLLTCITCV